MLKRKSDESDENTAKRVALDSEAVEKKDIEEDKQKTSVSLNGSNSSSNNDDVKEQSEENLSTGEKIPGSTSSIPDNQPKPETSSIPPTPISSAKIPTATSEDGSQIGNGPISSHKVVHNDDPTYVHFRMLCTISEAATIVGKGGETINRIKEMSNARINVSENLKGVPERVVSVRGPAEYVAKAFGLIVRMLLEEPIDVASSLESKRYKLRLLFPHTVMGYIIGKRGCRFREIEDSSAASLKASDQILPASTDRVLNINGVADAIHIATYYIAQTVIEHKQQLAKAIYYNPANFAQPLMPVPNQSNRRFHHFMGDFRGGRMGGRQFGPQYGSMMGMPPSQMMGMYGQMAPGPQAPPQMGEVQNGNGMSGKSPMNGGYYQPTFAPQFNPASVASNTRTGTITTGDDGKLNQEIFVPQKHIGLIIGRGGRNLKDIRQQTGCYVKINDEIPGSAERKLTLMGNMYGMQNALVLINNKIENEKMREQRGQRQDQQQPQMQMPQQMQIPPQIPQMPPQGMPHPQNDSHDQ